MSGSITNITETFCDKTSHLLGFVSSYVEDNIDIATSRLLTHLFKIEHINYMIIFVLGYREKHKALIISKSPFFASHKRKKNLWDCLCLKPNF